MKVINDYGDEVMKVFGSRANSVGVHLGEEPRRLPFTRWPPTLHRAGLSAFQKVVTRHGFPDRLCGTPGRQPGVFFQEDP